jgi:hypothetical protein
MFLASHTNRPTDRTASRVLCLLLMNKGQRLRVHKFLYHTAVPLFSNEAEFCPPSVEAVANSLDAIVGHLILELQVHLNPRAITIVPAKREKTVALSQLIGTVQKDGKRMLILAGNQK